MGRGAWQALSLRLSGIHPLQVCSQAKLSTIKALFQMGVHHQFLLWREVETALSKNKAEKFFWQGGYHKTKIKESLKEEEESAC